MKPEEIKVGRIYCNKSGRVEREIIARGPDLPVRWYGAPANKPLGEDVVASRLLRIGKTHYGVGSGVDQVNVYVSAFARWADKEVTP